MKLSLFFKEFYLTPEVAFDNFAQINPYRAKLSTTKVGKNVKFLCFHLHYFAKPPPVKQIDLEEIDSEN